MNKKQFRELAIDGTPEQKHREVSNLIAQGTVPNPFPQAEPSRGGHRQQGVQQQQTSLSPSVFGWHAVASVLHGTPPTYVRQRGFASTAISRTSAGIYVLTLEDALDIAGGDGIILGGLNGVFAVGATFQGSATTASTITTTTATLTAVPAAAAADIDYWIAILAIGPN